MKKFVIFLSSFALVVSVAYAMEEEAMDEEMMMEASAPSVAVGGSASIGIKNDSGSDNSLQLIRAYKVTFDSSGTTDGGLMFGAGMSIRDDTGEENEPVVKGSHVYVGGADGSWKVQFGGNDPGIDLVGGIGLADDHFLMDDEDATMSLEGSFGGSSYRLTGANPSNSVPARTREMTSTKTGPVTESGRITAAIYTGVTTNVLATPVVDRTWIGENGVLTVDPTAVDVDGDGSGTGTVNISTNVLSPIEGIAWDFSSECGVGRLEYYEVVADGLDYSDGDLVSADVFDAIPDGADKTTAFGANPSKTTSYYRLVDGPVCKANEIGAGDTAETMTVTTGMDNGGAVYAAMNRDNQWSLGFTHSLDTINVGVGMDSGKGLALGVETELSGVGLNLYYSKSEYDVYTGMADAAGKDIMSRQENTGLGVKASMAAGEGATFAVAYSTLKKEKSVGADTKDKKIELDFSYDLGGGATLKAGIDKNDPDGKDSNTVLEAKIAMSF